MSKCESTGKNYVCKSPSEVEDENEQGEKETKDEGKDEDGEGRRKWEEQRSQQTQGSLVFR